MYEEKAANLTSGTRLYRSKLKVIDAVVEGDVDTAGFDILHDPLASVTFFVGERTPDLARMF